MKKATHTTETETASAEERSSASKHAAKKDAPLDPSSEAGTDVPADPDADAKAPKKTAKAKADEADATAPASASFRVDSNTPTGNGDSTFTVVLVPIEDYEGKNGKFFKGRPSGRIELNRVQADAAKAFKVGDQVELNFAAFTQ